MKTISDETSAMEVAVSAMMIHVCHVGVLPVNMVHVVVLAFSPPDVGMSEVVVVADVLVVGVVTMSGQSFEHLSSEDGQTSWQG